MVFINIHGSMFMASRHGANKYNMRQSYERFRSKQKTFYSSKGRIKYIDQGEGKVILLLHGVPTSSWLYRKMITDLVEGGYRVIVPDMLGFGSSENPKGYDVYAADKHAGRLIELMDALQIKDWTHVMHDAGGLWTWELIKESLGRINNLVLLNTIIFNEGFHPPVRMKKGAFAKISMWLYKNGIMTNMLLKQLFKSGLKEDNLKREEVEGYKTPLLEGKTRALYYFFTQTCNLLPDYSSIIEQIDIPVAVIWGKHDEMLQWEPQKEKLIKALNIQAENIHIVDAKHYIQEEVPEEITSIILDFLR